MEQATHWSVDRLAASNLAAELRLEPTDLLIDRIAEHFAEHRRAMASWASERFQAGIVDALESASRTLFTHHDEDWIRGFSQAEEVVCTVQPEELLKLDPAPPRSRGQILRSMVRRARQR